MKSARFFLSIIFFFVTTSVFISCDENDSVTPQEEHFDAVGLRIEQSGAVMLDYFGPDYAPGTSTISDSLKVALGINPHWQAKFYDENRNLIDPPADAEKSFGAEFIISGMAELWWHEGEEGEFDFHIKGLSSGYTEVVFHVYHNDHPDFSTLRIPLVVSSTLLHDEPIGIELRDEQSNDLLAKTWITDSSKTEGTITVSSDSTTSHIAALFFDEYGVTFYPDNPPHTINIISSDTTVVKVTGRTASEPFAFKLEGITTGSATIDIQLLHSGSVGKLFTPVNVTVN